MHGQALLRFPIGTDFRGVREPAHLCDPAGGSGKAQRPGVESKERACSLSTACTSLGLILLALSSIAFVAGCAENSFQVRDPAQERALSSPLASEVLLEIDDASVKWGAGKVGAALKTALVKRQIFGQVHFPIYPTHVVPVKLRVEARGQIESESRAGFIKAIFTGLLMFLPVGVIQYQDTFTINAEVAVVRNDRSLGSFRSQSAVDADHILFATPESYSARAAELALDDLANRISEALSQRREWFSQGK